MYTSDFYHNQSEGSALAARSILNFISSGHPFTSVVDFGCGIGTWLREAENLGCTHLLGIEGPWLNMNNVLCKKAVYQKHDLNTALLISDSYNLAICVEVAEHLRPESGHRLISSLTECADMVIFGAAVPGQGGTEHINERPQSYWVGLFEESGFMCLDVIRPHIWCNADIPYWYKQNCFLFVKGDAETLSARLSMKAPVESSYDVVHPSIFVARSARLRELEEHVCRPSLRFCCGSLRRWLVNLTRTTVSEQSPNRRVH